MLHDRYDDSTATSGTTVWHLLPDRWGQTLRAKALSSLTERDYLRTARRWAEWLAAEGLDLDPDDIRAHHIEDFIGGIVTATSPANAAHQYRNMRVYFGWLVKREQITTGRNPMDKTEPPNVPEKLTPVLDTAEQDRIIAACEGRDFLALRDKALILFFRDTGARVSEVGNLTVDSLLLGKHLARVIGKGNRERLVGYSADTGLALLRYLKARNTLVAARQVTSSRLWLGRWGRALTLDGIKRVLRRRGEQAGVPGVHPHRFRHTYAHNWKLLGGSNEGLMATGGWSSTKMAEHYGKAARASRALAEQQRLMDQMVATA